METTTPIVATEENFLDILDTKNAMQTLELAWDIVRYFEMNYMKFQAGILEKPWNWPEYWIPALNGNLWDLEGNLTPRD